MNDTEQDVLPPADLAAEMCAVGSAILSLEALSVVRGIVGPDAFHSEDNRIIFQVLLDLADNNGAVDAVLLRGELVQRGLLEEVGGVDYIAQLIASIPDAAHAATYAQKVEARYRERLAIGHCRSLIARLHNPRRDETAEAAIAAVAGKLTRLGRPRTDAGAVLRCLADVQPRPVRWTWTGRIPSGCLTMLVGRPKEGKSFFTIDAAARVSTGTPWPDGAACERGSVLIISGEDDPARVIRPRLDAHRADLGRVHLLSSVRRIVEGKPHETMFTLADVRALADALGRLSDCRLCIIDPVGSFLGGGTDAHRDNEVRGLLAPVAQLAERHGVAMLVVAHRRKGSDGRHADDLALGSRAFTGIARANWHLCRDTSNKARRLLLPGGCNYVGEISGLAFTIAGEPASLQWEKEPVEMSADEALADECADQGRSRPAEERDAASSWLRSELAGGAERRVEEMKQAAEEAGLAWRTIQRAAAEMGVLRHRVAFNGGFSWRLPAAPHRATNG